MKTITFVVPCYNSEDYMHRCIDSLLKAGRDAEIIIVNDGSTDRTGEIANQYQVTYPDVVRVIHKQNGGHGSGVNAGLKSAQGFYFKVVDSDDWLDESALPRVMNRLQEWIDKKDPVDLVVCNYLYDHLLEGKVKRMDYANVFTENQIVCWEQIRKFRPSQYLIMHSLIFRTEILISSKVELPEHIFYVDNIFANQPLAYVNSIIYLNEDLYHYFLGREDQSVNEQVLMKRIDQQILVTKLLLTQSNLEIAKSQQPKLEQYLIRNISIMMTISSIHLLLIGDREALQKRKELWSYVKQYDKHIYWNLRLRRLSGATYLPGKIGSKLTLCGYGIAKRHIYLIEGDNMDKLYIGLVSTPGIFATMIRRYLNIPYIHVVLGLDAHLHEAYSVGRRFPKIPLIAGFEKEELHKIIKKYPKARYKIVSIPCDKMQKQHMELELRETYRERYHMHYAILGLFFLLLNRPFHQKNHFTCSSYLARLLDKYQVLQFEKHFSLVTPKDFYELKEVQVVYEGTIGNLAEEDWKEYEEEYSKYPIVYRTGMRNLLGTVQGQ